MELNKILSDGRWGDMAALVNANFEKIKVELMKLRYASILTFCKGYFSAEARLLAKYPTGKTGEYAFVGTPWPGTVWEWADTKWVDTKVAPQLGESIFVELLKQHIDNTTILWDDTGKYIYSLGGGGNTYTIAVSIDASSIGKCTVEATGEMVSVKPSEDGSSYMVTASASSSVTVKIVAKDNYAIQTLTVDGVSKGAITVYTFDKISANHTMSVLMEEDWTKVVPPIYMRSDVSAAYFGIYNAIQSVIDDYPNGLTKDVTITCTQTNIDYKGNKYQSEDNMWTAEMKEWNQDTPYVLTIDGADKCTLDGRGFGGIHIQECSNIIFRNITFRNMNTYEGVYAPEEPACIYAINVSKRKPCRNLYFENLTIHGQSTKTPASIYRTRYGITVKDYENVCMHNIKMSQVVVQPIAVSGAKTIYVSKLHFSESMMQSEVIGHPSIMYLEGKEVHLVDCDIDGSYYNEVAIGIGKVQRLFFERNHVFKTRGPVLSVSNELGIDKILVANNYMHDNMTLPKYMWDCTWMVTGNAKEFILSNNTIEFSSEYFQEFFMRALEANIGTLVNVGNVFVRKSATNNHGIFLLKRIDTLLGGNNIYNAEGVLYSISDSSSPVYFAGNNQGSLTHIQSKGYETGTSQYTDNRPLLQDNRPCLLPELAALYKTSPAYVHEFDYKYQQNRPDNCSIGCDNYYSSEFDETQDTTNGYDGINYYSGDAFAHNKQYAMPSDQTLVLLDKSKNRNKFVKFVVTKTDDTTSKIISLGKLASFAIQPVLDGNGEYVADQLYDVEIL